MRNQIKIIFFLVLLAFTQITFADYPVVAYRYLADPGALVYNGRVYIYCSNDDDNTGLEADGYEMHSIVCVSSSDLKNWTDHGVVFEVPKSASWAQKSWAPSPAERDGKFYLYFGDGGSSIGVAVSDSPTGPFEDPLNGRLITSSTPGVQPSSNMWLFDPMTFIDDDGQAYCYFGGNGENNLRVIKLNEDMISVDGSAERFEVPYFFEAAWMHKYNDTYYFSYSTNPSNGMRIDYMTSDDPMSGFTYGGVLSNQPPENNNNNHQAIFEFNGEWYQAYHNRTVARREGIEPGYKRNLCLDQFKHNADGSIEVMTNTVDGIEQVGYLNPFTLQEAETINKQDGIETELCNLGGLKVTDIENGDWIKVRGVDFGSTGAAAFTANLASEMRIGVSTVGAIEIRLDAKNGTLLGTVSVPYTGSLEKWESKTIAIEEVTGVHDIYFLFTGNNAENLFNFDSWKFIEKKTEQELIAINATLDEYKIDTVANHNSTNITVTAVFADGSSEEVTDAATFTLDGEDVIKIDSSKITSLNYGSAQIIANYNNFSDTLNVLVKSLQGELSVSRVFTEDSSVVLFASASLGIKIFAEFTDGHVEDVTEKAEYNNPHPEVATIKNGLIKAISEGEVDIVASYKSEYGEEKSTTISVTVNVGYGIWLEPECGEIGENWDIVNSNDASNGHYVTVQAGTESTDQAPGSEGLIEIPFSLDASGSFSLYLRLNCPSYDDDSFWISIDGGNFDLYNGLVTSNWEWVQITDIDLQNGEHTLTVGYREDGAMFDKAAIVNYPIEAQGMGEDAQNLCVPTDVEEISEIPSSFGLEQNYPNPFNPTTTISYNIVETSKVTLRVFDSLGRVVKTLVNKDQVTGRYSVEFDASTINHQISSGIYFYQLTANDFTATKKLVLLK